MKRLLLFIVLALIIVDVGLMPTRAAVIEPRGTITVHQVVALPTDLTSFVLWLGTSAGVGVALEVIAELVPGWAELGSGTKQFIVGAISLILPILSQVFLQVIPTSTFNAANGWYLVFLAILAAAGVIHASATLFHGYRKRNGLLTKKGQ